MIFFGEESLRNGIREFFAHYHGERNHQGLENRLIAPIERIAAKTGTIRRRQRLGGMLNYYYRDAAITIEMPREGTDMPESNIWILLHCM